MSKKKILLIGWDAADWKVINPLIDEGLMPSLEKLVNGGVIGNLATLDPPYSPMLWTSIATGKRPYQHGVLGFSEVTPDGKNVRPVMSVSRKVKAIWNILSEKGYKTHVAGWWPSHPAESINGICISDYFQKAKATIDQPWPMPKGTVTPTEYAGFFSQFRIHPQELTAEHLLPFVPEAHKLDPADRSLFSIANITAHCSSLHAAFTNIIRTQEWDFAALYLDAIDHYCHGFMRYHPPKQEHVPQDKFDLFKNVVTAGYRFHDMMLGRLMELAGEDTTIILVSDHGFQPDHLRPRDIPQEPAGPAYEHSPYGIICIKGPGIRRDEIIYGASLLDITPTILSLFDLPVGEDMDGNVLTGIYQTPILPKYTPTWEQAHSSESSAAAAEAPSQEDQEEMLNQLAALGYIEHPGNNKEENVKKTHNECQLNLARAYIDGGLIKEAAEVLEDLHEKNPEVLRYAMRLAVCYQMMGELKKCRAVIERLRDEEAFEEYTWDVVEAGLLIGERRPVEALKLLRKVEQNIPQEAHRLHLQMGNCYLMLRRWKKAREHIEKALELDFDNPSAHHSLGSLLLRTKNYRAAANAFLNAVGLDFYLPDSHIALGTALHRLGRYDKAAEALELGLRMKPEDNATRKFLIQLYEKHLEQPEKVAQHQQLFAVQIQGEIFIVSGLPRSGTSMMMQMLEKGGLPIFTDKKRTPDDNNPKGYYEHELVKTLPRNKRWLFQAEGKAVKIIANLLPHLPPNFQYKVIFMERDLEEVVISQRRMLQRDGKEQEEAKSPERLRQAYRQVIQQVKTWVERNPNVDILYVPHRGVIEAPFEQALRIHEFLDYRLLPELMAQAVDPSLHREKQ